MPKKKVNPATKRSQERDKRNRKAGLVKISPSYWVKEEDREDALKAINKAVRRFKA